MVSRNIWFDSIKAECFLDHFGFLIWHAWCMVGVSRHLCAEWNKTCEKKRGLQWKEQELINF